MADKPTYYDKRSDFWKRYWDKAKPYDEYLAGHEESLTERWYKTMERLPELEAEQLERLQGYDRELNILMYAGVWCGDCSRQGPMLKKIKDAIGPDANLCIIDRENSEELQDELRILGALRVPLVVFLSEDFWEVGRFGDRMLTVYRAKAARQLGRDFDAGILTPRALTNEMAEWFYIVERMLIMLRLSPPLRRKYDD
jgi:glutaredoxin